MQTQLFTYTPRIHKDPTVVFHACLGISPIKYLNKLRINSALIKIGANNDSMMQIAEMCGFAEQKYFNKVFKDETGKSPSQYRKELLNM